MKWHIIQTYSVGSERVEVMAATCDDGIGILATWERVELHADIWEVEAMDTESSNGMYPVTKFDQNVIPKTPPE